MPATEIAFPADHPTAAGHFPGNPIIPGALLLSETLAAIATALGSTLPPGVTPSFSEVKSAKFFAPARPGDRVGIEYSETAASKIRFTCTVQGRTVLTGEAKCDGPRA